MGAPLKRASKTRHFPLRLLAGQWACEELEQAYRCCGGGDCFLSSLRLGSPFSLSGLRVRSCFHHLSRGWSFACKQLVLSMPLPSVSPRCCTVFAHATGNAKLTQITDTDKCQMLYSYMPVAPPYMQITSKGASNYDRRMCRPKGSREGCRTIAAMSRLLQHVQFHIQGQLLPAVFVQLNPSASPVSGQLR